ncbi:hypothetical protein HDU97_005199 [Phlyctochytrium planicorne]|nr:hypothetical protein HDU97_005199 [Phlyctochytrium planicorne]
MPFRPTVNLAEPPSTLQDGSDSINKQIDTTKDSDSPKPLEADQDSGDDYSGNNKQMVTDDGSDPPRQLDGDQNPDDVEYENDLLDAFDILKAAQVQVVEQQQEDSNKAKSAIVHLADARKALSVMTGASLEAPQPILDQSSDAGRLEKAIKLALQDLSSMAVGPDSTQTLGKALKKPLEKLDKKLKPFRSERKHRQRKAHSMGRQGRIVDDGSGQVPPLTALGPPPGEGRPELGRGPPPGPDQERPGDLLPKVPIYVIAVVGVALVCVLVTIGFVVGRRTARSRKRRQKGKMIASENDDTVGGKGDGKSGAVVRKGGMAAGRRKLSKLEVDLPVDMIRRTNAVTRWADNISNKGSNWRAIGGGRWRRGRKEIANEGEELVDQSDEGDEGNGAGDDDDQQLMLDVGSSSTSSSVRIRRDSARLSIVKHSYEPSSLSGAKASAPPTPGNGMAEPSAPHFLMSMWDYVLGSGGQPSPAPPQYPAEDGRTEVVVDFDKIGLLQESSPSSTPSRHPLQRRETTQSTRSKDDDTPSDEMEVANFNAAESSQKTNEAGSSIGMLLSKRPRRPYRQMSLQKKEQSRENPSEPSFIPSAPIAEIPIAPSAPPLTLANELESFLTMPMDSFNMPIPPPAYTSIRSGAPRSDVVRIADGGISGMVASGAGQRDRRLSQASSVVSMGRGFGEWEGTPAWTLEDEMGDRGRDGDNRQAEGGVGVERSDSMTMRMLEGLPTVSEREIVDSTPSRRVLSSSRRMVAEPM